jgi:hypothetical protein
MKVLKSGVTALVALCAPASFAATGMRVATVELVQMESSSRVLSARPTDKPLRMYVDDALPGLGEICQIFNLEL